MAFSLIPDWVCPSIFHVEPKWLAWKGITLLLADLDNTLAKYSQSEPTSQVRAWKDGLKAAGVELFLLSNSRKPTRAKAYAQALGIPYLGHAGKPKTGGFEQAMAQMGRTAAQTAMVGDQIFTDILGAKRAGVLAIMVEPIELAGNPGRYVRYAVEQPFRLLGKRSKK